MTFLGVISHLTTFETFPAHSAGCCEAAHSAVHVWKEDCMDLPAIRSHKSIDVCVGILQETMNFGEMAVEMNRWLRSILDTIADMA